MILETGRVERSHKAVQQIGTIYSGFSFQEFRGTVVHSREKNNSDSSYLQNFDLSTEIKRLYSE